MYVHMYFTVDCSSYLQVSWPAAVRRGMFGAGCEVKLAGGVHNDIEDTEIIIKTEQPVWLFPYENSKLRA